MLAGSDRAVIGCERQDDGEKRFYVLIPPAGDLTFAARGVCSRLGDAQPARGGERRKRRKTSWIRHDACVTYSILLFGQINSLSLDGEIRRYDQQSFDGAMESRFRSLALVNGNKTAEFLLTWN